MPRARATVRLTLACNNRCVFCAQEGLGDEGRADSAVEQALSGARERSDAVTFVGGEPTLDPRLGEYVAAARSIGFRQVGIQTNGRRMADAAYVDALARAGLTDVHLSIHGPLASVHDYHTAQPGSFAEALASIAASRASGLVVAVTTVLARSNYRSLSGLPKLLAGRGVAAWLIAVAEAAGRAEAAFDRIVPRLGLAIPFALHAVSAAEAVGLPAWISGAPACLLGPFAARALAGAPREYGELCASCDARPSCVGVDARYLARFGGDELVRRARVELAACDDERAALFVGPGQMAPRRPATESIAPKKVALPLLGKVKPAHSEVPASTERKSGDALRSILPALFEASESKGAKRG